jgi:UDP-N-acetyl-2-amino-2-deoxyglucuronate dehydrogenase
MNESRVLPGKKRIGLVGTGKYAVKHAIALKQLKNAQLVGVVGSSAEKSVVFAERFGIKSYDDYESMLTDSNIDVIDIVVPNKQQEIYTMQAAKAKKHILIAKPMATNVEAAKEMIEICRENDVLLSVIFPRRSEKIIKKVKGMLDRGELGTIFLVNAAMRWQIDNDYFKKSRWRAGLSLSGGGVMIDQAIHMVDLLQWLVGEVDTVTAKSNRSIPDVEVETNCVSTLHFKNGAIGVLSASVGVKKKIPDMIELHGTRGSLVIHGSRIKHFYKKSRLPLGNKLSRAKCLLNSWIPFEIVPGFRPGFFSWPRNAQAMLKIHLREVLYGFTIGQSNVPGVEGIKSLKIVEAIYKSIESKRESDVK